MRTTRFAALMLLLGACLSASLWAAPLHNHVRIASPWPAQNTIITMLGYGDNLVGTSLVAKQIPLFRQSLPGIEAVPVVSANSGNELNPEQIISLGTQLLFVPKGMKVPQPELLEQAGVRILAFPANSMAALRERVQKTADVLGEDARQKAQAYEAYFADNVARVSARLKGLPDAERVRVYHSMGNPLTTTGRPSLNQDWMDLAGAINVAEHGFGMKKTSAGEVALEQLVVANPQVIVTMNKRDAVEIRRSAQWAGIDAVIHHRVVVNPKGMFWWCRETSEEALQFLWLAKTLYPQRFADIDMVQETRRFYHSFFGLNLTDAQINDILNPPQ
jgi:iron complex transport system substrate-binding protein